MSLANYRIPQIEQPQSSLLQKPVSIKPFNNGPQLLSRAELERKPTLDSERSSSDTLYSIGNAVLNSAPALIQQIGNSPTEKSGRVARTLGIGLEGAKLGGEIGSLIPVPGAGLVGAGIGAVAGVATGMLTGQKAVREEEERKLLLADKKFSDERQMLNQDYFLKQGYHNIESAQKILSKTNGYV